MMFDRTVLHVACEAGRDDICRRLLQQPGDDKANALYAKVISWVSSEDSQ
jgi:hypothetical protein